MNHKIRGMTASRADGDLANGGDENNGRDARDCPANTARRVLKRRGADESEDEDSDDTEEAPQKRPYKKASDTTYPNTVIQVLAVLRKCHECTSPFVVTVQDEYKVADGGSNEDGEDDKKIGSAEFTEMVNAYVEFNRDPNSGRDCVAIMHHDVLSELHGTDARFPGVESRKNACSHGGEEKVVQQDGTEAKKIKSNDAAHCLAFLSVYRMLRLIRDNTKATPQLHIQYTTAESMQAVACEKDSNVRDAVVSRIARNFNLVYGATSSIACACPSSEHSVYAPEHTSAVLNMYSCRLLQHGICCYPPLSLLATLANKEIRDDLLERFMLPRKKYRRCDLDRLTWSKVAADAGEFTDFNIGADGFVIKAYPGGHNHGGMCRLQPTDDGWKCTNMKTNAVVAQPRDLRLGDVRIEQYCKEFHDEEWRFYAQYKFGASTVFYVVQTSRHGDTPHRIWFEDSLKKSTVAKQRHGNIYAEGKNMIKTIFDMFAETTIRGQLFNYRQEGIIFRFDMFYHESTEYIILNGLHVVPIDQLFLTDMSQPEQAAVIADMVKYISKYLAKNLQSKNSWPL